MPRKALATARAALRFALEAADERGTHRHYRRVLSQLTRQGMPLKRYQVVPRTNAYEKLRRCGGQNDITWSLLQPV